MEIFVRVYRYSPSQRVFRVLMRRRRSTLDCELCARRASCRFDLNFPEKRVRDIAGMIITFLFGVFSQSHYLLRLRRLLLICRA